MRLWRVLGLAVSAMLCAAAPASAADLAGTTVITGSSSTYVDVDLPADVVVDLSPQTAPHRIEGNGPFVGVAFLHWSANPIEKSAAVVIGRFEQRPLCGACPHDVVTLAGQLEQGDAPVSAWDPTKITLPRGHYRVALVTQGPARVTVKLPGLEGSTTLTPTAALQPTQTSQLTREDPVGTGPFAVFNGGGALASAGILAISAVAEAGGSGDVEFEACTYQDEAPAMAFYPGCGERAYDAVGFGHTYALTEGTFATHWVFRLPKGTWPTGGNFQAAAPVNSAGWAATYIPFGGPPAPVGAAVAGPPAPPAPTTQHAEPARVGHASLASNRLRTRGRSASVAVRCSGGPCNGRVSFRGGRARTFALSDGQMARVNLRAPRGKRATIVLTDAAGTRSLRVRLIR